MGGWGHQGQTQLCLGSTRSSIQICSTPPSTTRSGGGGRNGLSALPRLSAWPAWSRVPPAPGASFPVPAPGPPTTQTQALTPRARLGEATGTLSRGTIRAVSSKVTGEITQLFQPQFPLGKWRPRAAEPGPVPLAGQLAGAVPVSSKGQERNLWPQLPCQMAGPTWGWILSGPDSRQACWPSSAKLSLVSLPLFF